MDIIKNKNGSITINNVKYKYKIFDITGLIDLIRNDKQFITSLENTIRLYRGNENFQIFDLIKEYINDRIDDVTKFFIIYKKNDIVSTCRFFYNLKKKLGYFNLIYTNPEYRNRKICQNTLKFIIDSTKKYLKKYELFVKHNNIPALKCYENNGFKKIKEFILHDDTYYYMRSKII